MNDSQKFNHLKNKITGNTLRFYPKLLKYKFL